MKAELDSKYGRPSQIKVDVAELVESSRLSHEIDRNFGGERIDEKRLDHVHGRGEADHESHGDTEHKKSDEQEDIVHEQTALIVQPDKISYYTEDERRDEHSQRSSLVKILSEDQAGNHQVYHKCGFRDLARMVVP